MVLVLKPPVFCPHGKGFTGAELVDLAGLTIWDIGNRQSLKGLQRLYTLQQG